VKLAILGAHPAGTSSLVSHLVPLDLTQRFTSLRQIVHFGDSVYPPSEPVSANRSRCDWLTRLAEYSARLEAFESLQPAHVLVALSAPPLLAAVYCDVVEGDSSLYPLALNHHSTYVQHLLLGQDGGAHDEMEKQIDSRLREVMDRSGLDYATVYGQQGQEVENALSAIQACLATGRERTQNGSWCWSCETCSDAACEHRLFSALISKPLPYS